MDPILRANLERVTRRQLFGRTATGVGAAALASLLGQDAALAAGAATPLSPKSSSAGRLGQPGFPNFAPRAKRVVYLWQGGGPSHIDLFDPKPELAKHKEIPVKLPRVTRDASRAERQAWLDYCHVLFCSNEFLYVD